MILTQAIRNAMVNDLVADGKAYEQRK